MIDALVLHRNPIQGSSAAVRRAVEARTYYAPRRSYLGAPIVISASPVFALVVPAVYMTERQPPESGLHPPDHGHPLLADNGVLLVLVVVAIAGWKWFIGLLPLRS
jgi:hypothetical protein